MLTNTLLKGFGVVGSLIAAIEHKNRFALLFLIWRSMQCSVSPWISEPLSGKMCLRKGARHGFA